MKTITKSVLSVAVGAVAVTALAAAPASAAEQKSLWDLSVAMQGGSGHSGDNFTEVVLINGTDKTMRLDWEDLYDGYYSKSLKPPKEIKPGQSANIGTKGTFLKGTGARVQYKFDGGGLVNVGWENPFSGKNNYTVQSMRHGVSGIDKGGNTWGVPASSDFKSHKVDSSKFGGGNRALVGFVVGDGATLVKGTYDKGSKCDDYDRALSGVSLGSNISDARGTYQDGEIGMIFGAIIGKIIAKC
ncbi:hypothetical protein [Streptomyces olivoreticuli]|uniref:hypothetical protein n=1 Tax=Streptomyces olivoreticuli TaxID=68246 RepID=UPI000E26DB10|nr:hypothetical protein [Streptomyces olivoreticuli]